LHEEEIVAQNLLEIEGIGGSFAKTLAEAGLKTTDDLLGAAGSAAGRKRLAQTTALSEQRILEWVNRADLMRVKGIGSEFSDLLEAAGVDTVKELAVRDPAKLVVKLAEVNEAKKLCRRTPTAKDVEVWVKEAKTMKPMVTH
jgi:predicted flap endonuclease-1-like 5' DNA nuclease